MRRSSTELLPLALLLHTWLATSTPAANNTMDTYCTLLASKTADRAASGWRSVSYDGIAATVTLVWGSEPAHAAAALLSALLRHVHLYRDVILPRTPHPHRTAALAASLTHSPYDKYTNLIVGVSTAWEPTAAPAWRAGRGATSGLAGPRLYEFGASSVPARRRLFARLAQSARASPSCWRHMRWAFYANQSALVNCGFFDAANPQDNVPAVEMFAVGDCGTTLHLLQARANATETRLYVRTLQETLIEKPVTGVSQRLHYKQRSLEETFVFVDQWCGSEFKQRLATWRVNATSDVVRGKSETYAYYSRPADLPRSDGASGCVVRSGDEFDPTCHDVECIFGLLLLALSPVVVLLARRRLARLRQEQQIQGIVRRHQVATVLAAYLVERAALELHEELGAGRFGSVRLARLREPARAPRYIAAKALRDNASPAEESEFLREACMIASLDHAHIVRLVGVCIADGPPLVLMELAFFGDLLGYLRARRHLVEDAALEVPADSGEMEHMSAEALTRLAREAAEALQYLGVRGVVHRDVRAANCLVDVRRSLKLADFGMARDTVAGADGAPEYSCRRRGLFPVLWMAPESLAHGVFSAGSDVWALGVLVLELVTLGARPYGTMSPLRVLEYVTAGGTPPLPLDATPQTRGLTRLCWKRNAEMRPSAAEVAAYLAAWPRALHPALLSERIEPADADSGFGESPSTELLPPASPLHSHDQLEDLAATQ